MSGWGLICIRFASPTASPSSPRSQLFGRDGRRIKGLLLGGVNSLWIGNGAQSGLHRCLKWGGPRSLSPNPGRDTPFPSSAPWWLTLDSNTAPCQSDGVNPLHESSSSHFLRVVEGRLTSIFSPASFPQLPPTLWRAFQTLLEIAALSPLGARGLPGFGVSPSRTPPCP